MTGELKDIDEDLSDAVDTVMENAQKYAKYVEKDGEEVLFISSEKVQDDYPDLPENYADQVAYTCNERLGWEKAQDLSEEERKLLSKDPNGYWNRVKRGFQRQKKAWLVPGNFLAGILAGALIDRWYVQLIVLVLIAGDIVSAWFHGRLEVDTDGN